MPPLVRRFLHAASRLTVVSLFAVLGVLVPGLVHAQPTTTRANVGPGGAQTEGDYVGVPYILGRGGPTISADGRWVAFQSQASDLVVGDTNAATDVFVRDQQSATTTRVSVGPGGVQGNGGSWSPTISADGRWLAFVSSASNLVAGDTNGQMDLFVRDQLTGTTTLVSLGPGGAQTEFRPIESAAISADGRWVLFQSSASNLVAGDTNNQSDVFVHDLQSGTTTRASVGSGGVQGDGDSRFPVISGDGRWVAFFSNSSNLVPNDGDDYDAFVHDRQTGTTTLLGFGFPVISADGRWVGLGGSVYDQQTGAWTLVSVGQGGVSANGYSAVSAISPDGRWVLFQSDASNLVAGDTNQRYDAFVHDRQTGATTRVSVGAGGAEANDGTYSGSISADGRWVVFQSGASNLVPGDTNGRWDVFVHDRVDPDCHVALAPTSAAAPGGGATGTVQVTMPAMCAWTAVSNDPTWLTVTAGSSGTGSGTVHYNAAANAGPPRTGSISIWGQMFTVLQAAAPPEAPTGLVAHSVAGNVVTLRWTIAPIGPTPTDFVLEGGLNPGEVLASLQLGNPSPVFTIAAPTGSFYLRMFALSGGLRSAASNEILVHVNVPVAPSAPANLLGLVDGTTLTLAWTNTYAGGAPTNVTLIVSGALNGTAPLGLTDTFTFAGVPPGTYTLSVVATNASGASAPSNPLTLTFPTPCSGAPEAARNFAAYHVGRTLFVSWDPPSSGAAPTVYVLNATGTYTASVPTQLKALSGPVPPGTYMLSVVAANPCGQGAGSGTQTVVVP